MKQFKYLLGTLHTCALFVLSKTSRHTVFEETEYHLILHKEKTGTVNIFLYLYRVLFHIYQVFTVWTEEKLLLYIAQNQRNQNCVFHGPKS